MFFSASQAPHTPILQVDVLLRNCCEEVGGACRKAYRRKREMYFVGLMPHLSHTYTQNGCKVEQKMNVEVHTCTTDHHVSRVHSFPALEAARVGVLAHIMSGHGQGEWILSYEQLQSRVAWAIDSRHVMPSPITIAPDNRTNIMHVNPPRDSHHETLRERQGTNGSARAPKKNLEFSNAGSFVHMPR